jgi:cell division FtsZ-interacting protein ZapD
MFKKKSKVSDIVATLVKVRIELDNAVEQNKQKIIKSMNVVQIGTDAMYAAINKAKSIQDELTSDEGVITEAAEAEIKEAKLWIESLPSPDKK